MIERPDTFRGGIDRMRFVQVHLDIVIVDFAAGEHASFVTREHEGAVNVLPATGQRTRRIAVTTSARRADARFMRGNEAVVDGHTISTDVLIIFHVFGPADELNLGSRQHLDLNDRKACRLRHEQLAYRTEIRMVRTIKANFSYLCS